MCRREHRAVSPMTIHTVQAPIIWSRAKFRLSPKIACHQPIRRLEGRIVIAKTNSSRWLLRGLASKPKAQGCGTLMCRKALSFSQMDSLSRRCNQARPRLPRVSMPLIRLLLLKLHMLRRKKTKMLIWRVINLLFKRRNYKELKAKRKRSKYNSSKKLRRLKGLYQLMKLMIMILFKRQKAKIWNKMLM